MGQGLFNFGGNIASNQGNNQQTGFDVSPFLGVVNNAQSQLSETMRLGTQMGAERGRAIQNTVSNVTDSFKVGLQMGMQDKLQKLQNCQKNRELALQQQQAEMEAEGKSLLGTYMQLQTDYANKGDLVSKDALDKFEASPHFSRLVGTGMLADKNIAEQVSTNNKKVDDNVANDLIQSLKIPDANDNTKSMGINDVVNRFAQEGVTFNPALILHTIQKTFPDVKLSPNQASVFINKLQGMYDTAIGSKKDLTTIANTMATTNKTVTDTGLATQQFALEKDKFAHKQEQDEIGNRLSLAELELSQKGLLTTQQRLAFDVAQAKLKAEGDTIQAGKDWRTNITKYPDLAKDAFNKASNGLVFPNNPQKLMTDYTTLNPKIRFKPETLAGISSSENLPIIQGQFASLLAEGRTPAEATQILMQRKDKKATVPQVSDAKIAEALTKGGVNLDMYLIALEGQRLSNVKNISTLINQTIHASSDTRNEVYSGVAGVNDLIQQYTPPTKAEPNSTQGLVNRLFGIK